MIMRSKLTYIILLTVPHFWGSAFAQDMASPPNSLVVDDTGNVGVGTGTPVATVHVQGPNQDDAKVLVENDNGTGDRVMFELRSNSGAPQYDFIREDPALFQWRMELDFGGQYRFCQGGAAACALTLANVSGTFAGDVFAQNFQITSSRHTKENFKPVDVKEVLEGVAQLPVTEWQFKGQPGYRHIGPVAEDFRKIFGIGDGTHISAADGQGIALAAIQGLKVTQDRQLAEKDAEIKQLKSELAEIRKTLATLMVNRPGSPH